MVIKCVKGGKLELSKTRLTEITGYVADPYYINLSEIKRTKGLEKDVYIRPVEGTTTHENFPERTFSSFVPEEYRIGCRTFSPATFAKILKAAGVKPKPVRKTDKRKVAR